MSSMRIGGIASGFDTDQIVKDLMKVERTKVDKLEQDKQLIQWKQETYNTLNKDLANFILDTRKDLGLTTTSSTGTLLNQSVSSLDWVKAASSSDETVATVSSTSSAVTGNYDVHVTSLATNVTKASVGDLGSLDSLKNQFALGAGDVIEFTIESIDKNGATKVSNTFSYSGADLDDKKISDIVNDINNFRDVDGNDLGVKAVYDSNINRFFLQTSDTGLDNGFRITKGGAATVDFITGAANKLQVDITSGVDYNGTDGSIDFAGATNISIDSNQVTINGITMNLKKANSDFTVTVDTDVDSVYEKIESFIEKYNEIVDTIGTKLGEKRYRDYPPLTDEQKEAMSEDEIKLWEEKAKSGLLRNDGILTRVMQDIRTGLYEDVEGVTGSFKHLTEIGISTEKWVSGSIGGKLTINETDLRQAIIDDVDGVIELLFKQPDPSETDEATIEKQSGLITRLYDNMIDGMKEVIYKAGPGNESATLRNVQSTILLDFVIEHGSTSILDKDLLEYDERIDDMNEYLISVEDRYWSKFTAMEKALSQMNQQSAWIAQQMGGMQ